MRNAGIIGGAVVFAVGLLLSVFAIWFPSIGKFYREWDGIIPPVFNLAPLLTAHFARSTIENKTSRLVYYMLLIVFSGFILNFFVHFGSVQKVRYFELVGATFVYAAFLFVVLSEVMTSGLNAVLTRWRGEFWIKELDYVYLFLGALGLAMSTNRLDVVDQKLSMPEYFGPFVIATALVVRAIKTRAEINAWHKG